jgi:hypothetical protein
VRGRHPKPPELRQRRNKTTTAATLEVRPDQLAVSPAPAAATPAAGPPASTRRPRKAKAGKATTSRRHQRAAPRPRTPPRRAPQPKGGIPSLPTGYHWHPETLAWWADAWASPMAAQWLVSDAHVLRRLAVLVNEFWHRPTPTVLAEIRQQQALLGLTPMDRHRLQWKIDLAVKGGEETNEADAPPPPAQDPREALRLIK